MPTCGGDGTPGRAEGTVADEQLFSCCLSAVKPCAELFDAPGVLLCCRQTRYYFKPACKSWRRSFMAALLLIGGVEPNPRPASSSTLNMGLINARSMVNKSALLHDVINEGRLDLLAVTETWVYKDSPEVHKKEAAPQGYSIVHAHRDTLTRGVKKHHGGGIALIHREDIRVKVLPTTLAEPTTFELLLVKIINCNLGMTVAIIYRPPNSNPSEFICEVSDLLDSGSLGPRFIICGDLNCPGPTGSRCLVGKELMELIDVYSFAQHVKSPTHKSGNILDHVLSPEGSLVVGEVTVEDVTFSDHSLIKYKITADIKWQPIVTASFRNWKKLDLDLFRQRLCSSSAYTQPATTADGFASQLEADITSILDDLAPVCTSTKRRGKPDSRWLSAEAAAAKQEQRKLERRWKSTGSEVVRVAYRAACRLANRLITESRRAFYARRVTESSHDPQALWRCVKGLLHTQNQSADFERGMCNRFSTYFDEKITKAKDKISLLKSHLSSKSDTKPMACSSVRLDTLAVTSEAEVAVIIAKLPNKSSPLDYIHTSVLKACSDVLTPLISRLANLSFTDGRFPDRFKVAQVTPLIKKEGLDSNDPANYLI